MLRFRTFATAAALALVAAQASASCYHQGYSYPVGYTMCSGDGWYQECTVAGYWKAIGMCNGGTATDIVTGETLATLKDLADDAAVALAEAGDVDTPAKK
ncbi:MAG: hypothetical protein ACFBSD_09365 [Paracoccaceae bacterium]